MLLFTRRLYESFIIGDDIVVKVLSYDEKNGTALLGIDAPKSVSVHREEIYNKIKAHSSKH